VRRIGDQADWLNRVKVIMTCTSKPDRFENGSCVGIPDLVCPILMLNVHFFGRLCVAGLEWLLYQVEGRQW
jgi:hypothetical protein